MTRRRRGDRYGCPSGIKTCPMADNSSKSDVKAMCRNHVDTSRPQKTGVRITTEGCPLLYNRGMCVRPARPAGRHALSRSGVTLRWMTGRDEMHWAENGGIDVSQHAEFNFEGSFTGGGRDMGHPEIHPSSERDRPVTLPCHAPVSRSWDRSVTVRCRAPRSTFGCVTPCRRLTCNSSTSN